MTIAVIILAAGQGTRMKSEQPKVLHTLAGKSLLTQVILKAEKISDGLCVVVHGHKGKMVIDTIDNELDKFLDKSNSSFKSNLRWVEQNKQLGTGHAVSIAYEQLKEDFKKNNVDQVLVLYGDVPLIDTNDINNLIVSTKKGSLGLITLNSSNPLGLGRVIRDDNGKVVSIVEEKDATSQQKLVTEINTGIFLLPYPKSQKWLSELDTNNNQNEYYLTDVVKKSVSESISIDTVTVTDQESYCGINTLYQLSKAERHYQFLLALTLLENGTRVVDSNRVDIRGELNCGKEVYIDINNVFEGNVVLGNNCIIEPNCILRNVNLGDGIHVKANSILENATIADNCNIGPFARVRPGTVLDKDVNIGNFVEIKKSHIKQGSKINHLSYIGDATVGTKVNIGAGTITCNYDGYNKYITSIGNNAFIGSNTSLVAPVNIGEGATVGAGSTISKDAPINKLTVARCKQQTIDNWQRKDK